MSISYLLLRTSLYAIRPCCQCKVVDSINYLIAVYYSLFDCIKICFQKTENTIKNTGVFLYENRMKDRLRPYLEQITVYLEMIMGTEI